MHKKKTTTTTTKYEFLLKTSFLVYFAKFIAFQKWYKMEDR